jgi:hypothetical protein
MIKFMMTFLSTLKNSMYFALYLNSLPQIKHSNVGHVFILIEAIWWVLGLAIYIYSYGSKNPKALPPPLP